MKFLTLVVLSFSLYAGALSAEQKGLVIIREETSVATSQKDSIAAIFKIELQKFGITPQVVESGDVTATIDTSSGSDRFFVLDLVRLQSRFILYFAEVEPASGKEIFSVKHSVQGLDELDVVVGRIVKAVLVRKPMEETQEIETLSDQETRRWKKKHGEFYWGFGIPFGFTVNPGSDLAYGGNIKVIYEMKHLRVDYYLGFAATIDTDDDMFTWLTDISVNYLFLAKNFSPYVGGGVGYGTVGLDKDGGFDGAQTGPVLTVSAGVEMFRYHEIRLLLGLRSILPLFKVDGYMDTESYSEKSKYIPAFLTEVTFVW